MQGWVSWYNHLKCMVPWQISPLDTPCRLDYLRNPFILGTTIFIPSLARDLIDLDWLLAHQHYDYVPRCGLWLWSNAALQVAWRCRDVVMSPCRGDRKIAISTDWSEVLRCTPNIWIYIIWYSTSILGFERRFSRKPIQQIGISKFCLSSFTFCN